jgi:CRP-like cAMP-binding protein
MLNIFRSFLINEYTPMDNFIKDFKIHRVYKKGEILYYENTPSLGLYCISEGTVKVYSTDDKGREMIKRLSTTGDIFGYGHLLGDKTHRDAARALEETQCYFIDVRSLEELLEKNNEFSARLMKEIGKELAYSQMKCLSLMRKNVRERLAWHFHYMGTHHGVEEAGKIRIKLQLSRDEIASLIGTASETAIRFISEFKEMGILKEEDRYFEIIDSHRLMKIGRL